MPAMHISSSALCPLTSHHSPPLLRETLPSPLSRLQTTSPVPCHSQETLHTPCHSQETLPRALRPIWLLATRIKVRVGTLTAALRTLNDCPAPPIVDPASLPANVFTVEAPMPFSTTSPGASSAASWGTHPAAAAYVRVDEELHWGGADRLAMLPGAELLPAHHLVLEESPRSSLYRAGPSGERADVTVGQKSALPITTATCTYKPCHCYPSHCYPNCSHCLSCYPCNSTSC